PSLYAYCWDGLLRTDVSQLAKEPSHNSQDALTLETLLTRSEGAVEAYRQQKKPRIARATNGGWHWRSRPNWQRQTEQGYRWLRAQVMEPNEPWVDPLYYETSVEAVAHAITRDLGYIQPEEIADHVIQT